MRKRAPTVRGLPVHVVSRTQLAKRSSVVVLAVGDRRLLVGVTGQAINLLGEVDVPQEDTQPAESRTMLVIDDQLVEPAAAEPLSGSILSPATWRQGVGALRDRTVRT